MRQIAERMVAKGHDVTVATSNHRNRNSKVINGVKVREFKAGGRLAIFTPNLLHYFGTAASLTPHWFHVWFNGRVRGFDQDDIFPTHYRANTRRRLRRLALESGFSRAEITLVEGVPSVLEFNSLLCRMGLGYKWLVNRYDFLSDFRLNIVAVAYKG